MLKFKFFVLVAALTLITATTAQADTRSLLKQNNYFEDAGDTTKTPVVKPASPWFNFLSDGTTATIASQDVNANNHTLGHTVTFKPSTTGVMPGQVSSVTINGSFSIQGWSTAGSNFTDLNQIPEGVTVTFKTATTFSVDAGNFLTLAPNGTIAALSAGSNGLGITQTQGSTGTLDPGETLHVGDMTITDVAFSGSTPGYAFSNPTISNLGLYTLRSGAGVDFNETPMPPATSENAGLYSVPPDPNGKPQIGFGPGTTGEGNLQSNVLIDNGFGVAAAKFTNTYQGAWDFKVLVGSMSLKGVGFQYNLGYDIVPIPPGDYNKNGVVDAGDYVLWAKGDLAADSDNSGIVGPEDYEFWRRANYGNPNPPGSGSMLSETSVPEPTSLMLLAAGVLGFCSSRRFSRARS